MPGLLERFTRSSSLRGTCVRKITAQTLFAVLTMAHIACVAEECPDADAAAEAQLPSLTAIGDEEIEFEADGLEATKGGEWLFKGPATIRQGNRQLRSTDPVYDPSSQSFRGENGVEYSDPNLKVRGEGAHVEPGVATFEDAQFELPARNARGGANRIQATAAGELQLDSVSYTTCPVGNNDWMFTASAIHINQRAASGSGRNVRLDFKGVPILYTPYITFPVGNERKSGFLFPNVGGSSNGGTALSIPWYWNIAPNYDATFVPTWYSKRGGRLDSEFRYLNPLGRGTFEAAYLPDDQEFGSSRSLVHFTDRSEISERMRLDIDAANASDSHWFEDFGYGQEGASVLYLNRSANLTYLSNHWFATARAQNFQTIDDRIAPAQRPHTMVPQLAIHGWWPDQLYALSFGLDLEIVNFAHNVDHALIDTGVRMDVLPEVRMPLRSGGVYLEPAAGFRYTSYKLDNVGPGRDDSPERSAPVFSVDTGVTFERNWGSRSQRLQTLEPRVMYLYVPYRNQDDLPVFDTDVADLNLVQLFRTNRYVGADRLSDANQLSVGITSRLLDADTGEQYIAATVGQATYFDEPRVALPGEVLDDPESSDIIAQLDVTAYGDWNVHMGVQWDPGDTRSEKGDVYVQYKPDYDRVMNLGYRFRRGVIEQVDGSAAWPVADRWSLYARMVYSLEDKTTLDQFAGVEYRACCWRVRFVTRRYVSDRTGDVDTSFLLQLELNGLSSVGVGADAFLERTIPGYSVEAEPRASMPREN